VPLPEGMPERVLLWRWYAKVYGWTPDQVDALPIEALEWLPTVEEAAHEAHEFRSKQQANSTHGPIRR